MKRINLGNTGLSVTTLCLGGNVFGWSATKEESFAVLDAYVAAGGNFIDTADAYSWWIPGNSGGGGRARQQACVVQRHAGSLQPDGS